MSKRKAGFPGITICTPLVVAFGFVMAVSASAQKDMDSANVNHYKQFCFYDGECTDTMLMATVVKDSEAIFRGEKALDSFQVEAIGRINPSLSSDSVIISAFMKSLEVYNRCAARRKGCGVPSIEVRLFFENRNFKKTYLAGFNEEEVLLENLSSVTEYDFKGGIQEIILSNGRPIVDFGQGTTLVCSKKFYEEYLFPRCLNFISKNPRLTNKNIAIPKLDIKGQE